VTHVRLEILKHGSGLGGQVLFAKIRVFTGQPMPDAARLVFYRPEFYGTPMKEVTHEAMRGPSQWSVGDRELMAAFVSKANECVFCIGAHTAAAAGAYHDRAKVAAVLADLETAPVDERLRATLPPTRSRDAHAGSSSMQESLSATVSTSQSRVGCMPRGMGVCDPASIRCLPSSAAHAGTFGQPRLGQAEGAWRGGPRSRERCRAGVGRHGACPGTNVDYRDHRHAAHWVLASRRRI